MELRPRRNRSRASEDSRNSVKECRNCVHAQPVTDRWLTNDTREPTLAGCPFLKHLALLSGECECGKWEGRQ